MEALLRESLEEGAWGYSTGLEYAQEQAATEGEVTALARHAPFYATHTRRRDDGAAEAVAEAIRTGDRAEVRLQVSHLVPRNGLAESRRCVELVDAARDEGPGRRLRHAHAHLRPDEPPRRAAAVGARARSRRAGRRAPRPGPPRRDAQPPLDPQRGRRLVSRRPARQRHLARARTSRHRSDRSRPGRGRARRRLRPAARRRRRAPPADGHDQRLQRGAAARGVRAPALRPRLGRDDPRAGRPTAGVVLPRRVHVGRAGSGVSWCARSGCSTLPRPCTD